MNRLGMSFLWILWAVCCPAVFAQETVNPASNEDEAGAAIGARPYELDWAGRTEPEHPQLVNFEDVNGWRVRCRDGADAKLYRSKQEMIFGAYTGKVVYSGTSARSAFVIEPPEPIAIPGPFTGINLWVRGNNWGWVDPPATPRVGLKVLVRDAKDENYAIDVGVVDFDYWFVMHATCVSPDGTKRMYEAVGQPNDGVIDFPARFTGIEVTGCASKEPARLYFDALSFYEIQYPPLTFEPTPENLPWPTTPDTILPTVERWPQGMNACESLPDGAQRFSWPMISSDLRDSIGFTYTPSDGTLSDLTAEAGGQTFSPCWKGGIAFELRQGVATPCLVRPGDPGTKTTFLGKQEDSRTRIRNDWELAVGDVKVKYSYTIQMKHETCIIDVAAEGADAVQFDIGFAKGLKSAKTVFVPYLTYGDDWPKVVCSNGPDGPIFLLAILDYYNSDASELFGAPRLHDPDAVGYTGGSVYNPTTAGKRNALRERLFITVSRDFHAVLPNIPNPNCDTGDIAREYVWRNIGAAYQNEMLQKYKAYGIDKFIACHHEVGWREGGESFTMRDKPAPGIGEQRLAEYGAFVRNLGYRFGTYTNYVDFAPVNSNWNEDDVCLNSDGSWQKAWPRNYALKPLRAVEKEAHYAPRIHDRYGTTAQYCDVHTAYTPWGRTDYDARTPGAGMFRTHFNSFARLLSNESKAHHGPVFSEGNYHWFYAGIVDGDYATIVPYGRGWQQPQIVDFDLLKMHPKMTDFGMGMPNMYYGFSGEWTKDSSRLSPWFDRFITATIAFGHIGFLTEEWGFDGTLKSYYLLQALQQRYAMVPVKQIHYFDGQKLVDPSTAIATDAYKRQQICTEYENGLTTWCNLSFQDDWQVKVPARDFLLPPGGFLAMRYVADHADSYGGNILAFSAVYNGRRFDYVECPEYLYIDTRGDIVRSSFMGHFSSATNTPISLVTTRGCVVVKRESDKVWWIIPTPKCEEVSVTGTGLAQLGSPPAGWPLVPSSATAHNQAGKEVADAEVRFSAVGPTVIPVNDPTVIKYRLEARNARLSGPSLYPRKNEAAPGETVEVATGAQCVSSREERNEVAMQAEAVSCAYVPTSGPERDLGHVALGPGDRFKPASVNLTIPEDAPPHTRCWFKFQFLGSGGPIGEARWCDITALPAFDLAFAVDAAVVTADQPFALKTTVSSNLKDATTADVRLQAADLLPQPLEQKAGFKFGRNEYFGSPKQTLTWLIPLPPKPVLTEIGLRAEADGKTSDLVRYLRSRPTTWVVADLAKLPFARGICVRGHAESEYDPAGTGALIEARSDVCGGERLDAVFAHPPYKTGVGYAFATFDVKLPQGRPKLEFAMGFVDGSTSKDGCIFKVVAIDQGKETAVFSEQYATLAAWARRSADLTPFAGRDVTIKLVTDVGPADDSYSDWAMWGAPRVVMDDPALQVDILPEKPAAQTGPPPEPLKDLARADLAKIVAARITMDSAGVNAGPYTSFVYFNGVKIGATPVSSSDTQWGPSEIPLTKEAIATIARLNAVVIKNPGKDYMKVRAICLRFELADGRRGSSGVDNGPYCSGAGWEFQEGQSVAAGEDLPEMILRIDLS